MKDDMLVLISMEFDIHHLLVMCIGRIFSAL